MNRLIRFSYKKFSAFLGLTLLISFYACKPSTPTPPVDIDEDIYQPSDAELQAIGMQIFQNETGGNKDHLVFWNANEPFPSLGLGHFLWFPMDYKTEFGQASFPPLIEYYKKHGYTESQLPKLLQGDTQFAPWSTREEMYVQLNAKEPEIMELRDFLYNTFPIQVNFIFERLNNSLSKMLIVASDRDHLKAQYHRMANSPSGYYPLIDYVNFKGEGLSGDDLFTPLTYIIDILGDKGESAYNPKRARVYQGYGWGLRQVLMEMQGSERGQAALDEFSRSAGLVLTRRVENALLEGKDESIFLAGWLNRTKTYAHPLF
ncbi:hypothetical protein [Entomospira culicis]|uniref:Uncharacterized protein n=1 Tax=Entomospira culicis TaxID=2719989 RepID=A0A968KU10_9SPIO|nr:hypothetical protein [Entomospira culicis]NIZ18804.1 hypothetical protein [Entomospira culicis]NIZ69019.1 hypothetical protein [Entomospira culicis]WDI37609.1 hypothetical protein PVA46_02140 [Entomospira culicis]WDI39237.1 hypothetical protein PVA47_02145 [Entomospira culicis]